jgi:integrase
LNGVIPAKHRTLESIAGDLAHFRHWMLEEEVDYLHIPTRLRARPTYRYCSHLHDELRFQRLKAGTAKRRMSSVQNFYRWLASDGHHFEHSLWLENDASLIFKDGRGFQRHKSIKTTDLTRSFKVTKNSDDYSEYINDGGKLRPLPKEEQIALVESLRRVGNTEMLLAFLLALTTGARLQTVFTLRRQHFETCLREGVTAHRLKVGNGTLINTKYGKQMVILIPAWLYRRMQIYLKSERYTARVGHSTHIYKEEGEQYAFLTRVGQPYYMANNDQFAFLYRSPPRGNAVTQFIRQQLTPDLTANNHEFEFRFHDLRATFGMNLLEDKLVNYQHAGVAVVNQPEFFNQLMYVKERMGHSQLSTTETYLNYRHKYHLAVHIQSEYEQYLERLMNQFGNIDDLD